MSAWNKTPPTYEEWINTKNHGAWWVKFLLSPRQEEVDPEDGKTYVWDEIWHVDCVQILCTGLPGDEGRHLIARGFILKEFSLDDTEATNDLFWQAVKTPDENIER